MISSILVPLDGSTHAERALTYALDLAKKYEAKVTLVHVVARLIYAFAETYGDLAALSSKEMEEEGHRILNRAAEVVKSQQVQASTRVLHGNPAEEIIKESENVDLIVIGCRGLTGVKAFLLGSVSSRVSRYARCPVLIVK